jgi:hypothetical protein
LPEVKAKTRIPILLPDKLPVSIEYAKQALVKASEKQYAISVNYELDIGNDGSAAFFSAEAGPNYIPQELPNVQEVKLAHGNRGFFRPVSCGGSCAPVNL